MDLDFATRKVQVFLHQRRGSKAALPESFHRAVGGYPCDQGMVSLRGLPELSTAGKVLPQAGCECAEGGHSERNLLGETENIPGEHHQRAGHPAADESFDLGGGRIWSAEE